MADGERGDGLRERGEGGESIESLGDGGRSVGTLYDSRIIPKCLRRL